MKEFNLKRCPFCANPNVKMVCYKANGETRFRDKYAVLCDYEDGGCGAESGHYCSTFEAQAAWNSRKRWWDV